MIRLAAFLALLLALALPAGAEERASLLPEIPKGTGDPHPEGNEYWRKNHMKLMKHDRDEVVHNGQRVVAGSLKECFDCHTVKDAEGHVVTVQDERHFCRTCHDYAAVKVDCFMCHRSTPDGVDEGSLHAMTPMPRPKGPSVASLLGYLTGVGAAQAAPVTTTEISE
ncbi:MAG: hypothetical protein ACWA47_06240 [Brevirhabdus sp.]